MKFLGKKLNQVRQYTTKAVVLLTLVTIVVPFSIFMPASAYAQTTPDPKPSEDALECSLTNPSVCLANIVYVFTVGLGSSLAYVGGFMLDTTVSLSLNSTAYALSFLSSGWTTARDLANMAFILILVYIAFMIMFQAETTGTIRMLAWVIFIALIINFSFFFTRVVIDASNILAVQFYNSIEAPTMQSSIGGGSDASGAAATAVKGIAVGLGADSVLANTKDLTASIMQALNIQQLFGNDSFKSFASQSGFGTKLIILSFLYISIGACYFILAAMFFAVSIMFLMRIVVLWFLIIASPLAFICKAVPKSQVSVWYDKWQHELISHAFYPAFFLFIFYFIYTVLSGLTANGGILGGMATDLNSLASTGSNGTPMLILSMVANIAIRLGFIIAMLYIALKSSEYMGVRGAEVAHRVTSFAFGQTGRLAAAPVGYFGRQTFGRAGTALANNKYISSRAENAPVLLKGALRGIDRGSKAVGNTLGKASYDPRNAPGVSILKKGVEKISGSPVGAGSPDKGGFMAQAKERDDRREAAAKEEKQKDREQENLNAIKNLAEKSTRLDELEAKEKAGTITQPEKTQRDVLKRQVGNIESRINGMSKSEVERFDMAKIQKVIKHLNKETVKKINESDKYSEKDKEAVRTEHDLKMREKAGGKGIEKSQEIVDELRGLHKSLAANAGISAAALEKIERATAAGKELNLKVISDASKQAKELKTLAVANQFTGASKHERDKAQVALSHLNEVIPHLEKLKQHIDDIPETIGGTPNPKEFIMA